MFSQLSSSSIASTFTSTSVSPMLRRSCIVSVFCRLWSLLLTLERQKRWMLVFVQRLFYDTSLKLQSRQPTPNSHLFQSPPWHRNYRILFGLRLWQIAWFVCHDCAKSLERSCPNWHSAQPGRDNLLFRREIHWTTPYCAKVSARM